MPSKFNTYTYTNCSKSGHSKERCYEIMGYPKWWNFNKKPHKKLCKAAIATTSNGDLNGQSGMINLTLNNTWIIDISVTYHMTNSAHHLTFIRPSIQ